MKTMIVVPHCLYCKQKIAVKNESTSELVLREHLMICSQHPFNILRKKVREFVADRPAYIGYFDEELKDVE